MRLSRFFSWIPWWGSRTATYLEAAVRWILVAITFLAPLFFVTTAVATLEIAKVYLFCVLVLVAAFLYLWRALVIGRFEYQRTFLDWLLLFFIVFYLVSTAFSHHHYLSFAGVAGFFSGSVVCVVCFVIFFYLLIQTIRSTPHIKLIILAITASASIVAIYNIVRGFGLGLPPTAAASFTMVAHSPTVFAVFMGICLLIGLAWLFSAKVLWQRWLAVGFLVLCMVAVFIFDTESAAYAIAAGAFMLLLLFAVKSDQSVRWHILIPTVVVTFAAVLLFINPQPLFPHAAIENVRIDLRTSLPVAGQSLRQAPLTGTGPQTFGDDLVDFRPIQYNTTPTWDLRFSKGTNEWLTLVATTGLLVPLILLVSAIWLIIRSAQVLIRSTMSEEHMFVMPIIAAFFGLLVASFFIPFSFSLSLLFWLLAGLGVMSISGVGGTRIKIKMPRSRAQTIIVSFALVMTAVAIVAVAIFGGRLLIGEYYFSRAQAGIVNQQSLEQVQNWLTRAITANPRESKFFTIRAQGYATEVLLEATKTKPDSTKLQAAAQSVVDALKQAQLIDPKNPTVYETEASIYDSLRNIIANADELAVAAYTQDVALEPNNPLPHLNLGRAQLFQAGILVSDTSEAARVESGKALIREAQQEFERAKQLKPDFLLADYNIGLAQRVAGDTDAAIETFQHVIQRAPRSPEAYWQLEQIYESRQQYVEAVTELEAIQKLLPDDTTVKQKLEELQAKLPKK